MEFRTSSKVNLDPRTKILLIILVNILLFSYGPSVYLYIASFLGIVLIMLLGKVRQGMQVALITIIFYVITYAMNFLPESISSIYGLLVLPIVMFMPLYVFAILLFVTTEISEIITAFQRMKIPMVVITPFIVMYRFFPTLRLELRNIREAMKLKGMKKNPMIILENIYVPLLFNSMKIGEELNVSGLTRGLGLYKTSTETAKITTTILDFIIVGIMIALILLRKGVIPC